MSDPGALSFLVNLWQRSACYQSSGAVPGSALPPCRSRLELTLPPLTGSPSFANPAVTLARSASDTFAGIRPADAPGFVIAQLAGATAATALFRWLLPTLPEDAQEVVVPHLQSESTHVR